MFYVVLEPAPMLGIDINSTFVISQPRAQISCPRLIIIGVAILFAAFQPARSVDVYNANGRSAVVEVKFLGAIQAAKGINYGIGAFDTLGETERQTLSLGMRPQVDLAWELSNATLYSTFSMVAATTVLDGELSGQIVRSGDRAIDTDSTKIGWKNDTFDLSVGGQDFAVGDGFFIGDGNFNKGAADGQYWIGAFTAWRNSAVLRVDTKPIRGDIFWLRSDDDLGDARIAGVNLETTTKDTFGTLGLMFLEIYDDNDALALAGMQVASIRGADIKIPGIDNLKFFGEFVMQRGESNFTGRDNNSNAWYVEGNYRFDSVPWTPTLFFRYSHFSGDEGDTTDSEEYHGAFYTIFKRDWDTWYQGEITGEFHLFNQNQKTMLTKMKVYPRADLSLGAWYYNHDLDTPQYFGTPVTDTDWSEEINVGMEYYPSNRFYTFLGFAWGTPHQGAIDAIGGHDDIFVLEMFVSYTYR